MSKIITLSVLCATPLALMLVGCSAETRPTAVGQDHSRHGCHFATRRYTRANAHENSGSDKRSHPGANAHYGSDKHSFTGRHNA